MPDSGTAYRYFRGKFQQWTAIDGSAQAHITRLGRRGLADEFQMDPGFDEVCQFVRVAGRLQLRSGAVQSAEGLLTDIFGVPFLPAIEIVLAAVADACGYKTEAEQLATAAGAAIAIGAGVVIIGALLKVLFGEK